MLLGTLSCGEADLPHCVRSVRAQTYPCQQYLIEDLPEHEANYRLYRTFFDSDADYMIRLDADMVLVADDAVARMVERIERGGWHKVTHRVADFFTGHSILGIHIYGRRVVFDWDAFRSGELFPDRRNSVLQAAPEERQRIWKVYDEPLALHCHHASAEQAFHFGFHRRMKGQTEVCARVAAHADRDADPRLRLACLGVLAAAAWPSIQAVSYGLELQELMQRAASQWDLDAAPAAVHALLGAPAA